MFKRLLQPTRRLLSISFGAAICVPIYYYTIKSPSFKNYIDEQRKSINRQFSENQNSRMSTTTVTKTTHPPRDQLSTPYTATFSVPMHCDSCTSEINTALSSLPGIHTTSFSIPEQLLTITGTTPPSHIINTIQSKTNRTAILRGSGRPDSAAVCILETPITTEPPTSTPHHGQHETTTPIRGLARLLELSDQITMLDLTLTNLLPGTYSATIRTTGDISRGVDSVGGVWPGYNSDKNGQLGTIEVKEDGRAGWVGELEGWRVWELIGRGVVVERVENSSKGAVKGDRVVVGVVARSAGVWENEKVVCACSGKTVWEEREEMVMKGMV